MKKKQLIDCTRSLMSVFGFCKPHGNAVMFVAIYIAQFKMNDKIALFTINIMCWGFEIY